MVTRRWPSHFRGSRMNISRVWVVIVTAGVLGCGGQTAGSGSSENIDDGGSAETAGAGGGGEGEAGSAGEEVVGTSFTPDIPADTPLADLPADQSGELCRAMQDYVAENTGEDLQTGVCRIMSMQSTVASALSGQSPVEACETALAECQASSSADGCPVPGSDCAATVGELKSCLDAAAPALVVLDQIAPTCAELETANLTQLAPVGMAVQLACSDMIASCPSWLGSATAAK
jgi:hypothetical protein